MSSPIKKSGFADDVLSAGGIGEVVRRKPRFLCLHGLRTSAEIMKIQVAKWPEHITGRLDLVFVDAPCPAEGKSDVEGIFPPPYYEWFQYDKDFVKYRNFDKCLAYIEEMMIKHGPFDGVIGYSQGGVLAGALPGLQASGVALTRVPKIKYVIIIAAAKFKSPTVGENAYGEKIDCTSLHFIGDMDNLKEHGEALVESYLNPFVIRHPKGHIIPRIDDKSLVTMLEFLQKVDNDLSKDANKCFHQL